MKKLLFLFVLILLSSLASALSEDDLVAWWTGEGYDDNTSNIATLTNQGIAISAGKINKAWDNAGTSELIADTQLANQIRIAGGTTMLWAYHTDNPAAYSYIYGGRSTGDNDRFYLQIHESSREIGVGFGAGVDDSGIVMGLDAWYHIAVAWNSTGYTLYVNGTPRYYDGMNNWDNVDFSQGLDFFATYTEGEHFAGLIDEFSIWNRTLTASEILEAYDNEYTYPPEAPEPGEPATPIIVAPSPADNANNNTNVTLNVTHSTAQNDVNYYLYFGDTSTLTESHLYLNNVTRTGDEYKSFVTNISVDGIYYLKWKVQNTTNGLFSGNTTQRTWTLDTVTPTITRLANNNWKTDNTTIISSYLNNLTLNISFFDTNLYRTLINITNETGGSVYNHTNTSITQTTDNISKVIDISGWTLGEYTIKLEVTDSHTANSIDNYDVNTGLNYFRYITEEGNVIKITSNNLNLFTKSTTKFKDRYDFEFNYLFQQDTYTFTIESHNKIDYIKDSDYNAHFVIIGNNGRGNWVDFNVKGLNDKDYKVTKIDDYIYEIEITANGLKSFSFSSLGGLNSVVKHYKLQIAAVIDVWVFDEENYPLSINATATIGTQSANSSINISGARLVNITKDITSLSLFSSGYGTEEKIISVTERYHNLSFNMTTTLATKLYFYDEKSEALIENETFSVYLEKTGFSQTFSGITDNPHTITGLEQGIYKLKASSANYQERQYLGLNISNVTTTILNIYLTNNTLGSEITFDIVSADGLAPLKDVRVVFTKTINGTDTVIAEEESDFAGQVIVTLDSNTQYTINFSKTDYEDKEITLEPKNLEYLIQMVSTVGAYNQSVHEGIKYRFEPSNIILNNNTNYNFTFTLNSTVWTVTNCTLNLWNGSILLDSTSSYTSSGCYIRIERNTANMTTITSEAIYELANLYEFTVSQQYSIIYTYEGQFSLKNFLDDISDFAMAGFDNFGRMMLAFIVIFIILTMASMKISFEHKEVPIFIFWALVGFFSYVNWFYLDLGTMPDLLGLKKWFIFYLVSLICSGFIINKFRA